MKENLIRALEWVITTIIGMITVDLIGGKGINFQHAIMAGIMAGIVDYIFSAVNGRIKSKKKR